MSEAGHCGGIRRQQAQSMLNACAREPDEVGESAIEREDAAGEDATGCGATVLDLDRESTKLVFAVGHAGGCHRIRHEDGTLRAFRPPPEADNFGFGMDAIANQLGEQVVVCQNCAENAGVAMIERAHGIERVGCAHRAGSDGSAGFASGGVGVTDRHTHPARSGVSGKFGGFGKLGRKRHQPHVAMGSIDEAISNT